MTTRLIELVARLIDALRRLLARTILFAVRFYQSAISPLHGPCCRFTPTCSEYCVQAIQKYGIVKGLLKTAWRVLRCAPWSKGGYDPP